MMRHWLILAGLLLAFRIFAYDVILLSDTHCDSREFHRKEQELRKSTRRNLNAWEKRMPALLQIYRKEAAKNVDFIIHCGDLAHGKFSNKNDQWEMEALTRGIAAFTEKIPVRFYCVKGNHETYCVNPAESSDRILREYLTGIGVQLTKLNYALVHQGDLYVFFDSNAPDLEFVRRTLAAYPEAKHTFFITHLPLLPCSPGGSAWLVFGRAEEQEQQRELCKLLATRNAVILCGHIHRTTLIRAEFPDGSITQLSVYSLPIAEKPGSKAAAYPREEYLTRYVKKDSKVPAHLERLIREHYREFAYFTPRSGIIRLRVLPERIEAEQFDYQGNPANQILLKEERPQPQE